MSEDFKAEIRDRAQSVEYDRYARRLRRFPGVTIRERISKRGGHIIDFDFEFPDGQVAEPDDVRYGATEASAIVFDAPDQVSEWQLRLPQIPADGRGSDQMQIDVKRTISDPPGPMYEVILADGERSYTPHVSPPGYTNRVDDPDAVLDTISDIWSRYRSWVDGEFR